MSKTGHHPLLGYGFLLYFLLCVGVSTGLMHWRDNPTPLLQDWPQPQRPEISPIATPDFQSLTNIREKKARFFGFIAEGARLQNRYFSQLRQWLVHQQHRQTLGLPIKEEAITVLANRYRVQSHTKDRQLSLLIDHIDEIPLSLVLAQAANESAWGTSRFALEANNFFGQWCFTAGCGLIPKQRPEGASYEVRRFSSAYASIAAYYDNINSHPSYRELREIRRNLRQEQTELTGIALARGLTHYSSRGEEYVKELQAMIRYNRLEQYDHNPVNPEAATKE